MFWQSEFFWSVNFIWELKLQDFPSFVWDLIFLNLVQKYLKILA